MFPAMRRFAGLVFVIFSARCSCGAAFGADGAGRKIFAGKMCDVSSAERARDAAGLSAAGAKRLADGGSRADDQGAVRRAFRADRGGRAALRQSHAGADSRRCAGGGRADLRDQFVGQPGSGFHVGRSGGSAAQVALSNLRQARRVRAVPAAAEAAGRVHVARGGAVAGVFHASRWRCRRARRSMRWRRTGAFMRSISPPGRSCRSSSSPIISTRRGATWR